MVDSIKAFDKVKIDTSAVKRIMKKDVEVGLVQRVLDGVLSTVQIRQQEKLWILERMR